MEWLLLFAAGIFEIIWATSQKYSAGFSKPVPTVITLIAATISFVLLGLAMKHIHLGTAYAVWTGIGAAGTFIVGIFLYGDPAGVMRIFAVALIISGVVLLKLAH